MRALLLGILIILAGCAAPTQDTVPVATDPTPAEPRTETVQSHPAYNYPTNEDLPEENETSEPEPAPDNETAPAAPAPAPENTSEAPPAPSTKWHRPAQRPLPDVLGGIQHLARVDGVSDGNGIALFGPLAFVGNTGGPMHIVDISEPTRPRMASTIDVPARDIDTILFPDDRLIVVTTAGGRQLYFTDVTEPTAPVLIATLDTPHSNHNLAIVPGTPIIYNSPSSGSITDIIDASDPHNPRVVQEWSNGAGCHDIDFFYDNDRSFYRGYCAGIDETQIWDIEDPLAPTVVSRIPFPAGGIEGSTGVSPVTFAHLATINHDGTILLVGDETGGGAAPGCDAYAHAAGTTASGPLGNIWFYDVSDERDPQLLGHVSPGALDDIGATCTAHFGGVVEDRNHAVIAFYTHGVLLIDFTDPSNPVIKDRVGDGNVWDVQYYQGYLFTGDMSRGMDVLTLV